MYRYDQYDQQIVDERVDIRVVSVALRNDFLFEHLPLRRCGLWLRLRQSLAVENSAKRAYE